MSATGSPFEDVGAELNALVLSNKALQALVERLVEQNSTMAAAVKHFTATPTAVTTDITAADLSSILSKHATATRTVLANPTPMPSPDSSHAPYFSESQGGEMLRRFFEEFEQCLKEAQISDDNEKLRYLPRYLSPILRETVRKRTSYSGGDYEAAKKELLAQFGDPKSEGRYTMQDLKAVVAEARKTELLEEKDLFERDVRFDLVANELLKANTISKDDINRRYFMCFTDEFHEKLASRLEAKFPDHDFETPFERKYVQEAARMILRSRWWKTKDQGDSRTMAERIQANARISKQANKDAELVQEVSQLLKLEEKAEKEEKEVDELAKMMSQLSLNQYTQAYTYLVMREPKIATRLVAPALFSMTTAAATSSTATPGAKSTQGAKNSGKCYYCSDPNCQIGRCQLLAEDIQAGHVKHEGKYVAYKDGTQLRNPNGTLRALVHAKLQLEKNATKASTTLGGNAVTMDSCVVEVEYYQPNGGSNEEDEGQQSYLSGNINLYSEARQMAEEVEEHTTMMVEGGIDEEVAREAAWALVQTRSMTKNREARESAKPYEKKDVGRRTLRFKEPERQDPPHMAPPENTSEKPNPWLPRAPWPKSAATSGGASEVKMTPGLSSSQTSPAVIQADTQMKDATGQARDAKATSGPQYRYSSTVEEEVDTEKVISRVFKNSRIELTLDELLALAPSLRKKVSENTKVKRVPITMVKANVVSGDFEEDGDYLVAPAMLTREARYTAPLPQVEAIINGQERKRGLLDSGSQLNLMSKDLYESLGLPINQEATINMRGVNLQAMKSIGICENVELRFGNVQTVAHFHVFEKTPYPFLLGQPWILDHVAAISEEEDGTHVQVKDFYNPTKKVSILTWNDYYKRKPGDNPPPGNHVATIDDKTSTCSNSFQWQPSNA
ncbi:hypothetical protein FS842_010624 [Serendipita sp. 407]|nr:hypothetical protein FS842_010624 [Serendipita sp. 407]